MCNGKPDSDRPRALDGLGRGGRLAEAESKRQGKGGYRESCPSSIQEALSCFEDWSWPAPSDFPP